MKAEMFDKFQIIGFIVSASVSIGLIVAGQDTTTSVILGFVLAIITQLFDLQLRLAKLEEKFLNANSLSQALYKDDWLFPKIHQIVESYLAVKEMWFELFRLEAQTLIEECRDTLHLLSENHMVAFPQSKYRLGSEAIEKYTKKSIKGIFISDINYWRQSYGGKYWKVNEDLIRRKVKITRIFVYKPEVLRNALDILERQQKIGIDVFVASIDNVPAHLVKHMLMIDDKVYSISEIANDGNVISERITIDSLEVDQMINQFDHLLRHAMRLELFKESLKNNQ